MPPSAFHKQRVHLYTIGYFWPIFVYFALAGVVLNRFSRLEIMISIYSHSLARLCFSLLLKINYG